MQIWNMKMKMAVIKVIYEAPQSHLWRRHDSLVSFMCGRPSSQWQASLPSAGLALAMMLSVSLQGWPKVTYRAHHTHPTVFVRTVIYTFNKNVWPVTASPWCHTAAPPSCHFHWRLRDGDGRANNLHTSIITLSRGYRFVQNVRSAFFKFF